MKGRTQKRRKKKSNKRNNEKISSVTVSQSATPEAADVSASGQTLDTSPLRTPNRTLTCKEYLTSTPVHNGSANIFTNRNPPVKPTSPEHCRMITRQKILAEVSPSSKTGRISQKGWKRGREFLSRKVKQGTPEDAKKTNRKNNRPPSKRRCGRIPKPKIENLNDCKTTQSSERTRPRFQLDEPSFSQHGESLLSSDLSIELSPYEETLPSLSQQEEEESEEEEDLPSFLQVDKKPPSITQGAFAWYKLRGFPFWPALVKRVNQKQKKANIMLIENSIIEKTKGFAVPLKSLKPFDCEEADELINKGKEQYAATITWSLELINDYRIRIACRSFSGSFIEYFAHDISHPVRRTYPQNATERLAIASEAIRLENMSDEDIKEESIAEQEVGVSKKLKRLLPDRTHAAHNRANERLVQFIVKQRMVEERLLAVIHGQQQSRWLRYYKSSNRRRVINAYLEDSKQLDSVYTYLSELHAKAVPAASSIALERVTFVLDVLLPEAITYAIAGVDNVSVEKAEEKYLKGRQLSKREKQEFDIEIEKLWLKSQFHTTTAHHLSSA